MPSETRRSRRSHRASAATASAWPKPLRWAAGIAALAVVLGGSLSFANATSNSAFSGDDAVAQAADVEGRGDVWAQVSRGSGFRTPLELEAGEPVTFTVSVDGQSVDLTSSAITLADALSEAGIVVDLDDVVSAPMGEAPAEGAEVAIERVGTQIEAVVGTIPFITVERRTSSLPRGTTQVDTEGVAGSTVTTFSRTYADGMVIDEDQLTSVVAVQPVSEVVLVGTGSTNTYAGSSGPVPTYTGGDPRAIAQAMLASYGWGMDQWSCLENLWQRESGWNPNAENPSSGAYGIPQALPGSKMGSVAADWRTNPTTQITWGLNYVKSRYKSPCGAWSAFQSKGWY